MLLLPRHRSRGEQAMRTRGQPSRIGANIIFDESPDLLEGKTYRNMARRGAATPAISASSMPASFGTHYTQARVSGSGEERCIRFAATKRIRDNRAEKARCRLARCRNREEGYLPHGTVTCRDGAGMRSHPRRPQQQRASSEKESREMPLCK